MSRFFSAKEISDEIESHIECGDDIIIGLVTTSDLVIALSVKHTDDCIARINYHIVSRNGVTKINQEAFWSYVSANNIESISVINSTNC